MFPFEFIKFVQPAWQFNIIPSKGDFVPTCFYHPVFQPSKNNNITADDAYETETAKWMDIGFRGFHSGHMATIQRDNISQIFLLPKPSLKDEYRFVAKYWGFPFLCFALITRLISLCNPFKEISAAKPSFRIKRHDLFKYSQPIKEYACFESDLIKSNPFVSVIIPTLNRYNYLADALTDLEKQNHSNFEVIIIDQSDNYNEAFYSRFNLKIRFIRQNEKLLWTARNKAIKSSGADYLLFFDDDSRVEADWIEQHLKCIDYFDADISAGVSLATSGSKVSKSYTYFRWADQFDSGNALVKKSVFKEIGLFDIQYNKMRQGDGEFGYRAFLNGYRSISNPFAARVHLKVKEGGLREMGSWDAFRQKKWFQPKPVPSVLFQYRKYLSPEETKHAVILGLMLSNVSYRHKKSSSMLFLSFLLFLVKSPVLYFQYRKADRIASEMLQRDKGIEFLK